MLTTEDRYKIVIQHFELQESSNFILAVSKHWIVIKATDHLFEYMREKGFVLRDIYTSTWYHRFIFERR